jgi:hypothetical protein
VLEARLRRQRGRLLGTAEDADEPPHLGKRLATGLLDDQQRLPLSFLLGVQEATDAGGLDRHDAHRMADDVVELACDAGPLLGNGCAGFLGALELDPGGALLGLASLLELPA